MTRVAIIAESVQRARRIAEVLGEDERVEVVDVLGAGILRDAIPTADVILAAGVEAEELRGSTVPVVLLSDHAGSLPALPFIHGRLAMDSSPAEIAAAVIAAAAGLTVLTAAQVRHSLHGGDSTPHEVLIERLTHRESQVLRMMADGLGNKEIASELKISEHTAKFHVAQVLGKLGAGSRAEAVAIGIRRGLIPI